MKADELVQTAVRARQGAYAPYSNFKVGAALVGTDGQVFTGANVENASYGLTICAERVAITAAASAGVRKFAGLAVVSGPGASMCGACRQVLAEFADANTAIYLADAAGRFRTTSIAELLPHAFNPADLKKPTSADAE